MPTDGIKKRGFASAIGSHNGYKLTLFHFDGHLIQSLNGAVVRTEVFND
jgi:hypothetical protein